MRAGSFDCGLPSMSWTGVTNVKWLPYNYTWNHSTAQTIPSASPSGNSDAQHRREPSLRKQQLSCPGLFCIKIVDKSHGDASVMSSVSLLGSKYAITFVLVSKSLILLKAWSCFSDHWNQQFFLVRSRKGWETSLKLGINFVQCYHPQEAYDLTCCLGWCSGFDSLDFPWIGSDSLRKRTKNTWAMAC